MQDGDLPLVLSLHAALCLFVMDAANTQLHVEQQICNAGFRLDADAFRWSKFTCGHIPGLLDARELLHRPVPSLGLTQRICHALLTRR